jgi:hypothetical protein
MQNFTQWLEQRDADFLDESLRDKILSGALALGGGTLGYQVGTGFADEINKLSTHEPSGRVEELVKKDKAREAAKAARLAQGDNPSVTEDPRDPRNQDPRITNASTDMAEKLRNLYSKKYGYKPTQSGPSSLESPDNPNAGWEMLSNTANKVRGR